MPRWPWIERRFTFDFPPEKFPELLERWRGTPARVEERVAGLPRDVLTRREGVGWTIQENVGHLIDLGHLPTTRLRQILAGESVLAASDMTNRRTHEAGHNERDIGDLLAEFRADRMRGVAAFDAVAEQDWGRAALHPRLKQPMRIVDILYFDSEHDDYHLGRIGELIRRFAGGAERSKG